MNTRLAEEQIFIKKKLPLIYLVEKNNQTGEQKIIQSHSGIFYVLVVIVIFFSLGLMLNIALKVQALNIGRKMIEVNEMISIERERADRIKLRITELKSPERILNLAINDLNMEISDNINFIKVTTNDYLQNTKAANLELKDENNSLNENLNNMNNGNQKGSEIYNNFIGTISNVKDIVMVVSEGVLTFFIP